MGGGLRNFIPKDKPLPGDASLNGSRIDGTDMTELWAKKHSNKKAKIVYDKKGLQDLDAKNVDAVLGLFSASHMPYDITRDKAKIPSLAEMTGKAIKILQEQSRDKDKGFLLFVEGGRIDHGHHDSKAKKALTEGVAMELAVSKALELTSADDTLILVTADHSHTFALAGYPDRTANIFNVLQNTADDGANYTSLLYANGPGHKDRSNMTLNNEV